MEVRLVTGFPFLDGPPRFLEPHELPRVETPPNTEPVNLQPQTAVSPDAFYMLPTTRHWLELHNYVYTTPQEAERFYNDWYTRIPNLDCGCMADWIDLTKKLPPDFSSDQAFFEWGWARHNDVNEKLHTLDHPHPPFPLEKAYETYRKSSPI